MSSTPAVPPSSSIITTVLRTRAIEENPPLAARAIELMMGWRGLVRLEPADARCVVHYMREVHFQRGDLLYRAGDTQAAPHMLLVLEGEVAVDTARPAPGAPAGSEVPIAVLGPGTVLGEMALLDGGPRSATCTAVGPVQCAGLARRGLERLLQEHPVVAARLVLLLAHMLAERLRALDDQLLLLGQIAAPRG